MTDFIKLHKLTLIILVVIFTGGMVILFYASYSMRTDNSVNIDKSKITVFHTPQYVVVRINSISSDEVNYYISYTYKTKKDPNQVTWDETINQTLSTSKDSISQSDLGSYVAEQISNKYNNIDQVSIKQQVEVVLATPNWEAPPLPEDSNIGANVPRKTLPDNSSSGSNSGGSNGSGADVNNTPPDTTPVVPPATVPPVYYPPYNGPPLPDVDNSISSTPIPN